MEEDFYELLGVARSASQEDIKRAYRKLARELHPDKNPEDAAAEDRFKKVTLAYEVLSDPERRRQYDTFGVEGLRGGFGSGDMFSSFGDAMFSDIFESLFGGFGGTVRNRGPRGNAPGNDLETLVELEFADAVFGTEVQIPIRGYEVCSTCNGSGAKQGTKPILCSQCDGKGEMRQVRQSILGQMVTSSVCPKCSGLGEEIPDPCPNCKGEGRVISDKQLPITIPAGVDNGFALRITSQGNAGLRGGNAGDLYVHVRVKDHPRFRRDGHNLLAQQHISVAQAILGTRIAFETLDGAGELEVPSGTQSHEVIRLKGHGVPALEGRGRGDLFVEVIVDIPETLSAEEEELLRKWAEIRGEEVADTDPGLISKLKSAFSQ